MDQMLATLEQLREHLREQLRPYVPPAPHGTSLQRSVREVAQPGDAEWLTTWKQIAWHLGVSEDSAQRYAKREEDPLPVQRLGSRVILLS